MEKGGEDVGGDRIRDAATQHARRAAHSAMHKLTRGDCVDPHVVSTASLVLLVHEERQGWPTLAYSGAR